MDITYVWGPDGPPESWKMYNAELAGVQNTLIALGFEAYSHIPGTGWSTEYWRNIEQRRYARVTYSLAGIEVEEIYP